LKAWKPRSTLQPGSVLILLAGRFRGKRVVLLKNLSQGVLLVTGPFKVNGVPLRRVNARYVIATRTKVDISGLDSATLEKVSGEKYFAREKSSKAKGEEAFFKQGEKPEVWNMKIYPGILGADYHDRRSRSPAHAPRTSAQSTRHFLPASRRSHSF